jgi:ATP-dependent DNA helicase RecQ
LKRFLREIQPGLDAIVCTNAFGMGLDVPDVRLVVHWQHPASIEDYLQEFGRAGRDGQQSLAVLFHTKDDRGLQRFMIDKSIESAQLVAAESEAVRAQKLAALGDVHSLAQTQAGCFRQALLRHFQGKARNRNSLGKRLLSWVFSERSRAPKQSFCCDVCARLGSSETRLIWGRRVVGK